MSNIISIRNLTKSFNDVKAVDNISFDVEEGSLFAFLGVNGAGKSTTINIICSLLKKDGGEVRVAGYDLDKDADKIKSRIGIVFQGSVLDSTLSVKDNLIIRASFYGLKGQALKTRLREISDLLELDELMRRPYGKLSGGQRRRVDIARALINTPDILILDEPTTGLDPQTRISVWKIIDNLRVKTGMTVFLTTHYMEEANQADKVVIIEKGRIVASDTPLALKDKYSKDVLILYTERTDKTDNILKGYDYVYKGEAYSIGIENSSVIRELIINHPELFDDFEVKKGDMDDVFLNVTGRELIGGEIR